MIHLDKKQHNFLIYISKSDKIIYKKLSDEQIKIANYLEENNLIDARYEAHKNGHNFGKRLYATISEAGKAYLSERKYELKKAIFQNCFWPITVSVIANLLISGIKLLLPLIQQWIRHTP